MAGHMNLLNPFVFNQFSPYGAYAQVSPLPHYRGNHPPKYKAASLSSGIAATATGRSDGRRCHGTRIRSRLHEPDGGSGNADTSWPKRHRPAPRCRRRPCPTSTWAPTRPTDSPAERPPLLLRRLPRTASSRTAFHKRHSQDVSNTVKEHYLLHFRCKYHTKITIFKERIWCEFLNVFYSHWTVCCRSAALDYTATRFAKRRCCYPATCLPGLPPFPGVGEYFFYLA